MAKAELSVQIPVAPLAAFTLMGNAMKAAGLEPFAQEGWTLKAQEKVGLFKMGWPATVTGTVGDDGRGGALIRLSGENMGIALNRIHVESTLRRIGEAIHQAAASAPRFPAAPPPVAATERKDDPNLPPRLG